MMSQYETTKSREDVQLLCPFSIPTSPEATGIRVIQNIVYFGLFYALFLWIGLSISLIPKRKVSLLLLVSMTGVTCSYLLLLRLLPDSNLVHRIIDKRLVLFLLLAVTSIELILTRAGIHLLVTLVIGSPIILIHALLRSTDDLIVNDEASTPGELVFLIEKKSSRSELLTDIV